jgi:hypothetical protein
MFRFLTMGVISPTPRKIFAAPSGKVPGRLRPITRCVFFLRLRALPALASITDC